MPSSFNPPRDIRVGPCRNTVVGCNDPFLNNPVTILPYGDGGGKQLGMHDHDTIFVNVTNGNVDKSVIAQAAATISHEAEHVRNARAGCAETDPTTAIDPDSDTDVEIAEALTAHAMIHI